MAYWPGNVKNYRGIEGVEFGCPQCDKVFHSQVILDSHAAKCVGRPPAQVHGQPESPERPNTRSFSQLQPVPPVRAEGDEEEADAGFLDVSGHGPAEHPADAATSTIVPLPSSPAAPPKKFITLKSGVQVKTLVVGTGGKVVRKIIVKAAPKRPAPSPSHACAHCPRAFGRPDLLHQHVAAYHHDEDAQEMEVDVTTAESPDKSPSHHPLPHQLDHHPVDPADPEHGQSINWEEVAGKKVNYPIALKKIPIGKRTSGKFWRTPTLKSGLPLVLKVVGGSGMEELSEAQKPLFCSVCRFLFKTSREMREHVVKEHLNLDSSAASAQLEEEVGEEEKEEAAQAVSSIADASPRKSPRTRGAAAQAKVAGATSAGGGGPTVVTSPVSGASTTGKGGVKLRFNCEECEVEFKTRENMVEHLRSVHRQKLMWQCGRCDFFAASRAGLGRHEASHSKDQGPSAYVCEFCGKSFVYESYLRRHRSSHTGDKFYACPQCGQNFKSQGRLVVHKATAHEGGGGLASLYHCPKCSKTFPYKSYLDRHVKTHISDIPKSCPHCQQVFQVESSLRKHIVKEHEGGGLLSCPHCDKKFLYPSYLVRHQTVHNNAREHKCPMCNKEFSLRGTLLDHLKSHLPSSDDVLPKSSTCEICQNKYRHESNLERHMQQMHPREWLDSLYDSVPDARFEEEVVTAGPSHSIVLAHGPASAHSSQGPEEEDVRVEFIDQDVHEPLVQQHYPQDRPL